MVKQAKSFFVLIVQDQENAKQQTIHADKMVRKSISETVIRISDEIKKPAIHYNRKIQRVHKTYNVRMRNNEFPVLIKRAVLNEADDCIWQPPQ